MMIAAVFSVMARLTEQAELIYKTLFIFSSCRKSCNCLCDAGKLRKSGC
jgi:hypothetical protein